jgi:hypothetical protein
MKKILLLSALALPCLAVSQQTASAFCNFKFSCGLNLEYTSGGNCFGWGLWKNGPGPGCCAPGCPVPGGMPYGGPFYGPMAAPDYGFIGTEPPAVHPVQYDGGWGYSGYQPVNYYQAPSGYGW